MSLCSADWSNESPACSAALNDAANAIGDIDVYFLYNTCDDPAAPAPPAAARKLRAPVGERGMLARLNVARAAKGLAPVGTDPNCFSSTGTLEAWGNQPSVKAALHVSQDIQWSVCSNNNSFGYNSDIADERTTIYPVLTQQAGLRVLVYNGEADLCVPYTVRPLPKSCAASHQRAAPRHIVRSPAQRPPAPRTHPSRQDNEWWTRSMNYTVKSKWASWEYQGDNGMAVGGYVTHYDYNFTFATVRGAGHMCDPRPRTRSPAPHTALHLHPNPLRSPNHNQRVPETRPAAALALFTSFIAGTV